MKTKTMDFYSTIYFIDTDFGQCFYFKSTYYSGFESSKQLVPTNVSDKLKMEMIRERQHHFDEECFHIARSKNNPNYREDNSRATAMLYLQYNWSLSNKKQQI